MNSSSEFEGKVAVVTGGGAGLGAAFARALCAVGVACALLDIDGPAGERVAEEIRKNGGRAAGFICDVADQDQVAEAIGSVTSRFGGIDLLINNAGLHSITYNQFFGDLGLTRVRRLFDVNLMGPIICSLECRPYLKKKGGSIINISSSAADLLNNAYGVSKFALRGLTVAMAVELASEGIRVNGIAPGMIATETNRIEVPPDMVDDFVNRFQLIHELGQEEDIVEMMLFLASSRARLITGETFRVTGGYPLRP
jgi:NAD(P)-dependent dehydrogenase (short-subunit alcohol dehydrogenase family)